MSIASWQELVKKMKETMSDVQQSFPCHGFHLKLTACSKKCEHTLGGRGLLAGALGHQLTRFLDEPQGRNPEGSSVYYGKGKRDQVPVRRL